jgi:tetratricopeptide (TPR) repeat protein
LLQQSRRRLWRRTGFASVPLILIFAILFWWQSPWGQIYLVKKSLISLSKKVNDAEALEEIARAFRLSGDFDHVLRINKKIFDDYDNKSQALSEFAALAVKMGDYDKVMAFLQQALQIKRKTLSDYRNKSPVFSVLAALAVKMAKTTQDTTFLRQGRQIAETIPDDGHKSEALSVLAASAAKIAETIKDMAFLEQGHQIAEKSLITITKLRLFPHSQLQRQRSVIP